LFCNRPNIRLKVSSNHFDPELFSANDEQTLKTNLGITPEDFVFIFVGRLVADKGINELIQAFQKVAGKQMRLSC
jgi:glycosyltransferase involved in cell wall biosynthesis